MSIADQTRRRRRQWRTEARTCTLPDAAGVKKKSSIPSASGKGADRRVSKFNLILDKGNVVTKKVKDMTEEEVKKAKKSIASEATRLSKEQLFGKEKKTREEKMEDKRLSRARKRFD